MELAICFIEEIDFDYASVDATATLITYTAGYVLPGTTPPPVKPPA